MLLPHILTLATTASPSISPSIDYTNVNSMSREPPLDAAMSMSLLTRSELSVSKDGLCSGTQTCLGSTFGDSCSQWGYCGSITDSAYAGIGCQPDFGHCAESSAVQSEASQSTVSLSTFLTVTVTASSACATSASSSATISPASTTYSEPSPSAASSGSSGLSSDSIQYTEYLGTGGTSDGWPAQTSWLSLNQLFEINQNLLSTSCKQWDVADNSVAEISDLKSSIQQVAQASGVDERFILAIVLQESNGCVRAPTTTYSVSNPGLMQSYQGKGTCNPGTATSPQPVTPCPASEITQMLKDGTDGTGEGTTSLVSALAEADCNDVSRYYKAARIYNSGSIDVSGLLQDGVATHCYASDIANRLLGWSAAPSKCTLNAP